MLPVQTDYSLSSLNTFGMDISAEYFAPIDKEEDLLRLRNEPAWARGIMLLGGGSNILFTNNVPALVLHNKIKGIRKVKEDDAYVWLQAGAGEVWHELVLYAVNRGYAGVENLSLIPGTVGAAPIQNIGAYGVEAKDVIDQVRFFDLETNAFEVFDNDACRFAYRDSIFKGALKNRIIITSVTFRLNKVPQFCTGYGAIQQELNAKGITAPSIKAISDAVIRIREATLPDPREIGNGGSFFKNPTVTTAVYKQLKAQYTTMPGYTISENIMRIPAAWMIEQCGWKGFRRDNYGVHKGHALVLVNHGGASGKDIAALSQKIIQSVVDRFGIRLEREVYIV